MKKILFAFMASVVLSSGCTGELSPEQPAEKGRFTAGFTELSKTSVNGLTVLWDAGDIISVNGYQYRAGNSGETADFFAVAGEAPQESEYFASYPSSLQFNGCCVSGILDHVQTARDGNVAAECNHSVAISGNTELYFKNLLALLNVRINVPGVASITLESNSSEPLAGAYTASLDDGEPAISPGAGAVSRLALVPGSGSLQENEAYLFSAIPGKLASGLKITFTFDASHGGASWSKTTSNEVILKRSTILDLGVFNYDFSTGKGSLELENAATAGIDLENCLSEPVSPLLFGSFSEMHGGDLVPGIIEQYMVNQSFEEWYSGAPSSKTEIVFSDVSSMTGVAYPWQIRKDAGSPVPSLVADCFNTKQAQRITLSVGEKATLYQRLALPVYRTMKYKVKFYAKVSGPVVLSAGFTTTGTAIKSDVFTPENPDSEWKCFEHEFTLDTPASYRNDRYGIYNFNISVSGEGAVTIDNVTLIPSDAVEGMFNPETVKYFKDFHISSIRWPGGNYTSQYHWKNGIGPVEKRQVLPNKAWNGLDSNLLGTDEIMRFCEITGAELVMGVGYGEITAEETADWVEYCNGSTSTEMGALRAENGHPEPYNVKYWGIGNEVYGDYQIGHCTEDEYSGGLPATAAAVRAVDPSVRIISSAFGIHNIYRSPASSWNATLLRTASGAFDILDTHFYVYGPAEIDSSWTGDALIIYYSAANLYYRQQLEAFKKHPAFAGKKLALMEWGVLPTSDTNTPKRQTFSNLIASASLYNEFIRQSDVVELAAIHNFSFYVSPQTLHSEPVNPRTVLFKELAPLAGGQSVSVDYTGVPTYDITFSFVDVGKHSGVPYLDIAAVKKGGKLYVSIVNRNPATGYNLRLPVKNGNFASARGTTYTSTAPYAARKWTSNSGLEPVASDTFITGIPGSSPLLMIPALSYSLLTFELQ